MFYNDYAEIYVDNYDKLTEEERKLLESKVTNFDLYCFSLNNEILDKVDKIEYIKNSICTKDEIVNICSSLKNITDYDIEVAVNNTELISDNTQEVYDTLKLIKELKK